MYYGHCDFIIQFQESNDWTGFRNCVYKYENADWGYSTEYSRVKFKRYSVGQHHLYHGSCSALAPRSRHLHNSGLCLCNTPDSSSVVCVRDNLTNVSDQFCPDGCSILVKLLRSLELWPVRSVQLPHWPGGQWVNTVQRWASPGPHSYPSQLAQSEAESSLDTPVTSPAAVIRDREKSSAVVCLQSAAEVSTPVTWALLSLSCHNHNIRCQMKTTLGNEDLCYNINRPQMSVTSDE